MGQIEIVTYEKQKDIERAAGNKPDKIAFQIKSREQIKMQALDDTFWIMGQSHISSILRLLLYVIWNISEDYALYCIG